MNPITQNPAYAINGKLASSDAFYAIACDPTRSVAVEACAGAGKTWMLIERIVKALNTDVRPDQILAITFTKKAAGEMRERLQKRLVEPELRELRSKLLTGGRTVQISTFHAWFAQLLRAAPLSVLKDLKLPLSYELLEDDSALLPELRHAFYAVALTDIDLQADFAALIEELGRSKVDDALVGLLAKRIEFELADAQGLVDHSVEDCPPHDVDIERLSTVAKRLGTYKGKKQISAASSLEETLKNQDWDGIVLALLTAKNEPRSLESKDMQDDDRALLVDAQNDLLAMLAAQHQHACWLYQQRMTRVGRAWLACFAELKRSRGLVDMADLERAASALLSDSELSGAVQERLDQRLRHVMIDEFQDTNPMQWQAIHAWLASYAGSGGGLGRPSLFIVGDPKQSIYRFRRAEPRVFAAAQAFMQETFDAALLSCDHTRRNALGVLDVVNSAMLEAQKANEYQGFRAHTTQSEEAGAALCLPLIERTKKVKRDATVAAQSEWRNSLTTPRELEEETLKAREADQAARWIAVHGAGQSVMVLSRTHEPLNLIHQALQRYGIAASKQEKNDLADAPAVQDALALLNFLVSPHSDMDLARALKSPLFGWSDGQLMQLRTAQLAALPNKLSWFEVLEGEVKESLQRWQAWMQQLPPHDALQAIYDDGDVLNKYLAAMPYAIRHSSHLALQALLGAALQAGGGRFLSGYVFVRAMRAKMQSIKAPTIPDRAGEAATSVQLLTVHGAKGLEADIVLLLASDPEPRKLQTMTTLIDWQPQDGAPSKFVFLQSEAQPPSCAKALLEAEFQARAVEELNTLYVATTRARQMLVLSASEAHLPNPQSAWHRLSTLCSLVAADVLDAAVVLKNELHQSSGIEPVKMLPQSALTLPPIALAAKDDAPHLAAQKGKALHRLLQWQSADSAAIAAVKTEFSLTAQDVQSVDLQAQRILNGEAAWLWNADAIDWQANEYELVHEGRILRIDRLIKHRATQVWWVIDFKSSAEPEKSTAMQAQLKAYQLAIAAEFQVSANQVQTAFVTGDGHLLVMNHSVHN